ncbi:membrane protein, partial [Lasius niger]
MTNVPEAGKIPAHAPANVFASLPTYPPIGTSNIVCTNYDTLYSNAWLDLSKGPVVVSTPDTHGRYFVLPMMDMWSDVFASPGSRTTGTKAANYLLTLPDWHGEVPEGMTQIKAPTPYVWLLARTRTDGPKDYDAVHQIQSGYNITPLENWGKPAIQQNVLPVNPTVDMKTPADTQISKMSASEYFTYVT